MSIRTIECDFEYQMKKIIEKFKNDWDLQDLTAEELQEKIWVSLSAEFGKAVLEACNNFSGDELFENEEG